MLKSKNNNNSITVFFVMICFLIIAPQYVYLFKNINVVNFTSVIVLFFYLIFISKVCIRKIDIYCVCIWLFYCIYSIQCLFTASIMKFATFFILFILLPYILYSLIRSKTAFVTSIDLMIKAGFVLGIYGLIEELLKINFLHTFVSSDQFVFHEIRYGLLRIMGTFGHPIGYGLFHVFIVALILYRLSNIGGKKCFLQIAYVVCVLNVIFTVSRIPILSLLVLHLLLITKISKRKAISYIVLGTICIFIISILLNNFGLKIPFIDDLVQTVLIISDGGTNLSTTVGVGSRFELFFWVVSTMDGNWLFGHGVSSQFAYQVYEWATKTSIENQYLNILYFNGAIGLFFMLISYIASLVLSKKNKVLFDFERISFNDFSFFLLLIYYLANLGVQESDMTRMYVYYLVLLVSYNKLNISLKEE